jgi:hypothetical protein
LALPLLFSECNIWKEKLEVNSPNLETVTMLERNDLTLWIEGALVV